MQSIHREFLIKQCEIRGNFTSLSSGDEPQSKTFQSHNGLILTKELAITGLTVAIFQSHNGLILTLVAFHRSGNACHLSIPQWSDFNSSYSEELERLIRVFQSHNGLILTLTQIRAWESMENFQSHNGLILTNLMWTVNGGSANFQSHNGLILTPEKSGRLLKENCFQSHNGLILT